MKIADTAHNEGPSAFAQAAELELRDVSKRYPGQREPAIGDLSLTVPAGEVCVLVGPSGSGKTTAMRLINRMIPLTGGDILLGGRSVLEREPRELRREIGYVIQQVGLFPHQTVGENIATVPRLLGWDKQRIAARVQRAARADRPRPRGDGRPLPGAALGRAAPARRRRARARRRPAADADGRAVRRDRPDQPRAPAGRVPRAAGDRCARRSCSSRTTSTRRSRWATASRSCARAACSRSTTRPREILTRPADEFVAQFVGADRALKRLSLTTLAEMPLLAPDDADGAAPSLRARAPTPGASRARRPCATRSRSC